MEHFGRAANDPLRNHTYVEYYNLVEPPFGLVPDPRFIYQSRSHSEALRQLVHAFDQRERVIAITGEVGVGKTMICRMLLQRLRPLTPLSQILDPFLDADDFLKQVLLDFGAMSSEPADRDRIFHASRDELVSAVREVLASRLPVDERALIVVDEAQDLDVEVLEQIHLLTQLETPTAQLQIILVGQPEFESLLRQPTLSQLNNEVSCRCRLRSLTGMEVGPYIEYRLSVARGGPAGLVDQAGVDPVSEDHASAGQTFGPVQFTPAAVRLIAKLSRGIPRAINSLCDRSLQFGSERQLRIINCKTVLAAAEQVPLPLPFMQPLARVRPLRGAAFRVMLGAALASSWASLMRTVLRTDHRDPIHTSSLHVHHQPRARGDIVRSNQTDTRDIEFRTRPFGFDKAEVRALMSKLLDEHEQALAQIEALRRQLNRVPRERVVEPTPQPSEPAHLVERILASAHRVADDIRKEAERDAGLLLVNAEQKVARILDEATAVTKEKSDAAANRLRNLEREIERMRVSHRAVRAALEAAVTAVGATLADLSAFSTLDAAQHTDDATADPLKRLQEDEATAQV